MDYYQNEVTLVLVISQLQKALVLSLLRPLLLQEAVVVHSVNYTETDHQYENLSKPKVHPPVASADKIGAQLYNNPEAGDTVRKMVLLGNKIDVYYSNNVFCEDLTAKTITAFLESQRANVRFTLESVDADFAATVIDSNIAWKGFLTAAENLRIHGKFKKNTFKHILASCSTLKVLNAMHTDYLSESSIKDFFDALPRTFDTVK
uniref:Uncharacterized protein n=1 Tax=Panagrolaimus superbus TaxID=310955 RepID=A0A914YQW1_9BILA